MTECIELATDSCLTGVTVGPNFNDNYAREQDYEWAVSTLSQAYLNVLREFASCTVPTLRLLPISGSIFAGKWKSRVPQLTIDSWIAACGLLTPEECTALAGRRIEMCIYDERELGGFVSAFGQDKFDVSSCHECEELHVPVSGKGEMCVRSYQNTTVQELRSQVD